MGRSKKRRTMDACKRKIRFGNPPPMNEHVRPYHCENCGGWHATSRTPKGSVKWGKAR